MSNRSKTKSKQERKDTKTILLVDCSSLEYAALYAYGHLSYGGEKTGIIYGFLKRVFDLAEKFHSHRFIFCYDSGTYLRSEIYPEYKLNRAKLRKEYTAEEIEARESLLAQSTILRTYVLPTMGFHNTHIQQGFEADDLLAYWINKLRLTANPVVMVTSDADMFQCLDHCDIWTPTTKKLLTRKQFQKRYGVKPDQWALAKAIGGCSTDNVIGIDGVSDPKNESSKALKYIRGEITKGVIFDRIESKKGKTIIARNLQLVTVPYSVSPLNRMIRRKDKFSRKGFIKVFDHFHFRSFLQKKYMEILDRRFLQ